MSPKRVTPKGRAVAHSPHRKSQSWVNKSSSERHLTTRYGKQRDKLAQAQHDGDAGRRDDDITEQKAERPTSGEGPCGTQKETSANDTSDATTRSHSVSMLER